VVTSQVMLLLWSYVSKQAPRNTVIEKLVWGAALAGYGGLDTMVMMAMMMTAVNAGFRFLLFVCFVYEIVTSSPSFLRKPRARRAGPSSVIVRVKKGRKREMGLLKPTGDGDVGGGFDFSGRVLGSHES
jgi:hypothetical protein